MAIFSNWMFLLFCLMWWTEYYWVFVGWSDKTRHLSNHLHFSCSPSVNQTDLDQWLVLKSAPQQNQSNLSILPATRLYWYKREQDRRRQSWTRLDVCLIPLLQTCPPACCVCVWLVQCTVRRSVRTWPLSPPCLKRRPTCMPASTRSKRSAPKTLLILVGLKTVSNTTCWFISFSKQLSN